MKSVFVSIPTFDDVKRFVDALTELDGDFDLVSGKYILDARSLMGVFSLDLSQPIQLDVYNDSPENIDAISEFIVKK